MELHDVRCNTFNLEDEKILIENSCKHNRTISQKSSSKEYNLNIGMV